MHSSSAKRLHYSFFITKRIRREQIAPGEIFNSKRRRGSGRRSRTAASDNTGTARRRVINTIRSLPQTMLIASHDLDMILDTCQRVILLSGGKIVADGEAETILRDKTLLENNRMELPLCLQGAGRK